MGKFDGVLLASDFDNTLIYTEPSLREGVPMPALSEKNRAALETFMAEGGRFAISTGRALASFARYQDMVPMNAPGVICNGAAMYDFEKKAYLETAMLGSEARERGQQVLDKFPEVAVEAYHVDNVIHAVHANQITHQHEHITQVLVTELDSLLDAPVPLGKLLFEAEHEVLEKVLAFLKEQGWEKDYELIFSVPTLLEMTAKGACKGNMVERLAEHLGISMEHVYCIGDEANDLSMLTAAARGFIPANCNPILLGRGFTQVAHCQDDALAEVIDILDQQY